MSASFSEWCSPATEQSHRHPAGNIRGANPQHRARSLRHQRLRRHCSAGDLRSGRHHQADAVSLLWKQRRRAPGAGQHRIPAVPRDRERGDGFARLVRGPRESPGAIGLREREQQTARSGASYTASSGRRQARRSRRRKAARSSTTASSACWQRPQRKRSRVERLRRARLAPGC